MKTQSKFALTVTLAALAGGVMIAADAQPRRLQAARAALADRVDDATLVGHAAPAFTLTDLEGNEHSLAALTEAGKTVVLEWFNPGCPYVVAHYSPERDVRTMVRLQEKYADQGVVWLRINSGAPGKQGHGVEYNTEMAKEWSIAGPILIDESGTVGQAYGAATTPHMYVIDSTGVLRYAGAIDDLNEEPRGTTTKNYVDLALAQVLAGETVSVSHTDAYGCGVKYAN